MGVIILYIRTVNNNMNRFAWEAINSISIVLCFKYNVTSFSSWSERAGGHETIRRCNLLSVLYIYQPVWFRLRSRQLAKLAPKEYQCLTTCFSLQLALVGQMHIGLWLTPRECQRLNVIQQIRNPTICVHPATSEALKTCPWYIQTISLQRMWKIFQVKPFFKNTF